jgi:hypothetical protein
MGSLAAFAETVNAIVVALTLVVLIVSVRQNTQSQRVLAVESLSAAIASINVPGMQSPALGAALAKVTNDWKSGTKDERIIAHYFLFSFFKLHEQAWYQRRARALDAEQWAGWEKLVRLYYHSAGVQSVWWPSRAQAFSQDFQNYLRSTTPIRDVSGLSDLFEG